MKIGFIGCGTITEAIVLGLYRANYPYDEIIVSERNAAVSARLARECARVRISGDNQAIANGADMLFLAVRPQVAEAVLSALAYRADQIVVSLVASLTHERLRQWTGPGPALVRAMPLPFVATGDGPTLVFPAHETVEALFDALGQSIPAATLEAYETLGVASTTMGFYFGLQEALVDWLTEKGIDAGSARAYVGAIFVNLARVGVAEADKSLAQLRQAHSTRGGFNEQMYRVFVEQNGVAAITAGLDSVRDRARRANPSEKRS